MRSSIKISHLVQTGDLVKETSAAKLMYLEIIINILLLHKLVQFHA